MKIVIANNKGGQGKTLLAVLLIQYLQQKKKGEVAACDLDRTQLNLTDSLQETGIKIYPRFSDIPAGVLCVVDTPPHLDDNLMEVIKSADSLIVPITLGKHAVQGVRRIAELRDKQDTRFVVNAYDESTIQKQSRDFLQEKGFKFSGIIPRYKRLAYNVDCGLPWYTGFPPEHIKYIERTLENLTK